MKIEIEKNNNFYYDIYKKGLFFEKKIGRATVKDGAIYMHFVHEKFEKYARNVGVFISTHYLQPDNKQSG